MKTLKNLVRGKRMQRVNYYIQEFIEDEEGLGIVELVLIIIVLIGLVMIFKEKVKVFIDKLFDKATQKIDHVE